MQFYEIFAYLKTPMHYTRGNLTCFVNKYAVDCNTSAVNLMPFLGNK